MREGKNSIKISLLRKFSIAYIIIIITSLFFGGFILYRQIKIKTTEVMRKGLTEWAVAASNFIDVEEHEKLINPADENSAQYEKVRKPLSLLIRNNERLQSIYTLRKTGESGIGKFVIDTTDPDDSNGNGILEVEEDRAHLGEEYNTFEYPAMEESFSGKPAADQDVACDKWGCWLSGYAPLRNEAGKVVAIVGVDLDADDLVAQIRGCTSLLFMILLLTMVISFIVFLLVFRFFSRPLMVLEQGIEKFSENLDYRIDNPETGDEFESITKKFNEMAEEVAASHRDLEKRVARRTKELSEANKDLSEKNSKLKEMDEMRKNFVSYTAHELKNPLNVFRWSLEMLRNEDLGKINLDQREIIDQVYTSNERLMNLVKELLDVSRLDEVRLKVQPAPCRIEDIIDEAAGNLAVKIKNQDLKFVWNKPATEIQRALADKDRILQVLLNLLSNAVKFTPSGKKIEVKVSITDKIAPPDISARYGFVGKDKKYILVSVADEGLGIPKAEQEKMFTRFFRGSNVKKANIEGTGLGMFITFEIVKLHNGALWFESEENKGTKFYFTLPAV
jgi:signal transduction histidine kinase